MQNGGCGLHRHRLRRHAARPEHRHLARVGSRPRRRSRAGRCRAMPMAAGSPKWTGAPWAPREARAIAVTALDRLRRRHRPHRHDHRPAEGARRPARDVRAVHRHVAARARCAAAGTPGLEQRALERERAAEQERHQVVAPPRRAGRSARRPARRAGRRGSAGRSVRRSAPGATPAGSGEPGSVTSSSGHGFGLRWQKSRKSNA